MLAMIPYPSHVSWQKSSYCAPSRLNSEVADPTTHRLYALYKSKQFTDYTIFFQDREYRVHKCILASSCAYFSSCLATEDSKGSAWKENTASIMMQFEFEVPSEAFEHFLVYLYTDRIPEAAMEEYSMLFYEFGDYFMLPALSSASLPFVAKLLTMETYRHVIPWMEMKENEDFDEVIVAFIRHNRDALFAADFQLQLLNERILRMMLGWRPPSSSRNGKGKSLQQRLKELKESERSSQLPYWLTSHAAVSSRTNLLSQIRQLQTHNQD